MLVERRESATGRPVVPSPCVGVEDESLLETWQMHQLRENAVQTWELYCSGESQGSWILLASYDLEDCGRQYRLVFSSEGLRMSSIFMLRRVDDVSAYAGTGAGFRLPRRLPLLFFTVR